MKIIQEAIAGTLESSDILIRILPADELDISLTSSVEAQFKEAILTTIKSILNEFGIDKAKIIANDKGALDCVIRARLITVISRSTQEKLPWEKII